MAAAGARENYVTTMGGPEHSLADPATNKDSTGDSIVVERIADGDDIVVVPDAPTSAPRGPRRTIVGAVVAIVLIAGVAAAVATRHHSHSTASRNVRSVGSASPPAAHPTAPRRVVKPEPKRAPLRPLQPKPVAHNNTTTPVAVAPPVSIAAPPPATPATSPPPPPVTAPPVTTPPVEPASVLRCTATPAALTVKGGGNVGVTITVANPTKGTVTLGTPLSCAPVLRGPHGAVIGQAICEQMAQLMAPHSTLTQHFTIYATDTASAGGQALKPGVYTATFENLFKIKVNVTAS